MQLLAKLLPDFFLHIYALRGFQGKFKIPNIFAENVRKQDDKHVVFQYWHKRGKTVKRKF